MSFSIKIDHTACQGEKACIRRAPRTFSLDRKGKAKASHPPGDSDAAIREAAGACPHFAIALRDEEGHAP